RASRARRDGAVSGSAVSPDRRAVADLPAAAAPRRARRRGLRSNRRHGRRARHPPGAGGRLMRPLDGVRVLDFTWVVAGPVATRILADLGADVIKVERRGAADFGDRRGGLSGTLTRGKRSVVLDLNRPRGLDLARRLAAVSDVVIDNFSARVMSNLGLDYEEVCRLRPDVICVRMTGFGLDGPYRDHVSYGPTLQALTGYTLLMAEPGAPPARFARALGDPEWTGRFVSRAARLEHAAELDRLVAAWSRTQVAEEAMALLQTAGVAAGVVANAEDLCARDPQLAARGHFVEVPTPEGRTVRIDGPPFLLSDTPARLGGPGPLLGEH